VRIVSWRGAAGLPGEQAGDRNGHGWYIYRSGARLGPFSTPELVHAGQSGLLAYDDQIWRPGLPRWFMVYEITDFLPPRPPVEPPAPHQLPAGWHEPTLGWPTEAPAPAVHRPPTDPTFTRRIADEIVQQIVAQLDRHQVSKRDHMAKNGLLRDWSARAYEAIPGAMRLTVSHSVGRRFVEDRIYKIFLLIRTTFQPGTGAADLRRIALEQAPVITAQIDEAIARAGTGTGSWSNGLASLLGGQTDTEGFAALVARRGASS
jgi:GYF domain 2